MCIDNLSAKIETISVPINIIYCNNDNYKGGGEMVFELLTDIGGEKFLTLQANDISGKQIFGDMLEGPFRCIHQTRDFFTIGDIVIEPDAAELRVVHTFIPKDNDGKIWRFALVAINGTPTYYEISEWNITDVSNGLIHYRKTGKKAIINYNRYSSIKPVLDMIRKAEDLRILRIEELN